MGVKQSKQQEQAAIKDGKAFSLIQYFEDSKAELGKVSWPTKKEVRATCLAVLALVCIMSVFLGLVDFVWASLVQAILSIGI